MSDFAWEQWIEDNDEGLPGRIRNDSTNSSSSLASIPPLISSASTYESIALHTPSDSFFELHDSDAVRQTRSDGDSDAWMVQAWRDHRLDVKEGKKPQRPICYDSLIADLPEEERRTAEDNEEWWGLEYTVELSRREHEEYDGTFGFGEHSKSRQSWAAIHQAWTHPLFQNEEYLRWRSWHLYLERQEEERKIERLRAFYDLSTIYVRERVIREWLLWHIDNQTEVPGTEEVDRHLYLISTFRPDPYFPPVKHNLAWLLKRSRSVASLRELVPHSWP